MKEENTHLTLQIDGENLPASSPGKQQLAFYDEGHLKLCIKTANLFKDTEKVWGKMDPWISFEYNGVTVKTLTAIEKGTSPVWNQIFEFYTNDL